MIGISKLYCGTVESSDVLRYGRNSSKLPSHLLQFSEDKKPVVVWNITKKCNLHCVHCYSQSNCELGENELSTFEGKELIDDLKSFGVPVILFSGGEPLIREDIFELIQYTYQSGIRAVLSTNGTLITKEVADKLAELKLSYVGISIDGIEITNDNFRGLKGSFQKTIEGIRNCKNAGIKVGLRFTINKRNFKEIPDIFHLLEAENVDRICFYHLVYAGRGSKLIDEDLSHEETRGVVDQIIDLTKDLHFRGLKKEVLTVDNHCDGPYLYLRLLKENNPRAEDVYKLLQFNKGNSSGVGIGCVSWDGSVYADQFWRHYSFGNVREKPFSKIWTDTDEPLMKKLKHKKDYVKGRCSTCKWLNICGGNFRVRAEATTGDLWACDPACYLTDIEISK